MTLKQNPERVNLWNLPNILSVDVKPVQYNPPRQFWVNQQVKEVREGVELLVKLAEPIPSRAVTPALYIGDTPITDYEVAGQNLYRFFVTDPGALQPNALLAMGWPSLPKANNQLVASNFRFQMRKTDHA